MITCITGKPGDGKSMYATAKILKQLVEGETYVVTNVPLNAPDTCAYVAAERAKKKDDRPFVFDDEVRVLKDEEVYEFYRRRSGGLVLPQSPDFECEVRERLERPEFVAKMKESFMQIKQKEEWRRPVWYYIDEAHNFFSAREWASAGRGMLYYASQHRHLHDQIFFITQVVDNLEKQLRGLTSELHRVRNHMRRSVGPFKMRPCFKVEKFYGCPGDQTNSSTYDTETMFLDPAGVAACYQTVGALGVQSKPEKLVNAGIFPWWLMWVAGGLAVLCVAGIFVGLPFLGSFAAKKVVSGGVPTAAQKYAPGIALGEKRTPAAPTQAATNAVLETESRQKVDEPKPAKKGLAPDDLYIASITMGNGRANISLSDGTVHSEDDGTIKRLLRNSVVMRDGSVLYLRERSVQGSGAKGAPVRPDAAQRLGDGAPAAVSANVSNSANSTAVNPPAAANLPPSPAETYPSESTPASSWYTDKYGVKRLIKSAERG